MAGKKDDTWAKLTEYCSQDGRRIAEFEIIEGPKRGNKVLKGKIMIVVKPPDPRMQPQRMPFEFDFPDGKSFSWARAHFDEEADKAVKVWQEEQAKARGAASKQIVPATTMPRMLGPDGKPLQMKLK